MKRTLVSLVSDQTIPNVEFIKEFGNKNVDYFFIITKQKQAQLEWIIETTQIKNYEKIMVNPFDPNDILEKLNSYDYGNEELIINITGGTKLMSLVINEFFKDLGAVIYYLTGHAKTYIKLFPNRGERKLVLTKKLSLHEYLKANGFEFKPSNISNDFNRAEKLLQYFILGDNYERAKPILRKLQANRSVKKFEVSSIDELSEFLEQIDYKKNEDVLTKYDARYITGDWFEEYIYYRVQKELELEDNEIGIGYKLIKLNVPNEIDVLFIYNHKLYIIECKTSFYDYRLLEDGTEKKINLLGEIIYKSDALRNKFGLFASTYILTIGTIRNEQGEIQQNLKTHIKRAELSHIPIISRQDILSEKSINQLLNIN